MARNSHRQIVSGASLRHRPRRRGLADVPGDVGVVDLELIAGNSSRPSPREKGAGFGLAERSLP